MQQLTVDDCDRTATRTDADRRPLTGPLAATDVAVDHCRLGPGERLSPTPEGYVDREAVFLVTEGTVTFHTPVADGDSVTVPAGDAVRFARAEFRLAVNDGDEEAELLAVGAPRDGDELFVSRVCPACETEAVRVVQREDGRGFVCPDCGEDGDDLGSLENGMGGISP